MAFGDLRLPAIPQADVEMTSSSGSAVKAGSSAVKAGSSKKTKHVAPPLPRGHTVRTYRLSQMSHDPAGDHQELQRVMRGLNGPAVRRLARRGGVRRVSSGVLNGTREALHDFLEGILTDATKFADYSKRNTVKTVDIVHALKRRGRDIYGSNDA